MSKNREILQILTDIADRLTEQDIFMHYMLLDNISARCIHSGVFDIVGQDKIAVSATRSENVKFIFDDLKIRDIDSGCLADFYFIWGYSASLSNQHIVQMAFRFGRPLVIFEDGFLRSADTSRNLRVEHKYTDGISFTIDIRAPYFCSNRVSSLEMMLNDSGLSVSNEELARSRRCIDKILSNHLSKYNHQPIFSPCIGRPGVKKVLVVDQAYGDLSVIFGWANDNTFQAMLEAAIEENPNSDIIVKIHPDSLASAKSGYYSGMVPHDNIYVFAEPINPISLINYCHSVYVCTSQLGFEAMLCGKPVKVFGMPFYAGWGVSIDQLKCDRRARSRSIEEIFYIAYILYSKYVDPREGRRCNLEDALDYLIELREDYFNDYKILRA